MHGAVKMCGAVKVRLQTLFNSALGCSSFYLSSLLTSG